MRKKDITYMEQCVAFMQKLLIDTQPGMPLQYIREFEKVIVGMQVIKSMMTIKRKETEEEKK